MGKLGSRLVRAFLFLALCAGSASSGARAEEGLIVAGKIRGGELILTRDELLSLPQVELTEQPMNFPTAGKFRGPRLLEVLQLAGAEAGDATLVALDEYKVTITAAEMAQYQPILAVDLDGVPLAGHDFGPYYVMWPFREHPEIDNEAFQSKAIWQVIKIDVR